MPAALNELLNEKLTRGTANFVHGPCDVSRVQSEQCVTTGLRLAQTAQHEVADCLCLGEMGIGNTTASVIAVALTGWAIDAATGRGTGLDAAGLLRKQKVIARA